MLKVIQVLRDDTQRTLRHGKHLLETARSEGWTPSMGEGPLEYLMRKCYETGHEDAVRAQRGDR